MPSVTFASLLTPEGIVVAAGIVTSLIGLLKGVIPALAETVSGATMAFVGTAILYGLVGVSVGVGSLDAGLAIFLAWLACATAAVGIRETVKHVAEGAK